MGEHKREKNLRSNPNWKSSGKPKKDKYVHVSVEVGSQRDPGTGLMYPVRTPKGEGNTYVRKTNLRG